MLLGLVLGKWLELTLTPSPSAMFYLGRLTARISGFSVRLSSVSYLECGQLQALGISDISIKLVGLRSTGLFHHAMVWSLFRIIIFC